MLFRSMRPPVASFAAPQQQPAGLRPVQNYEPQEDLGLEPGQVPKMLD